MRPFAPPLLLLVGLPRTAPFHFADPRTKLVHAVDDALPKSLLADISREAIASHEWESRSRPPELRDSKASTNWMPIEQFSKPRSYAELAITYLHKLAFPDDSPWTGGGPTGTERTNLAGAEWWVQLRDTKENIGFHYDKDEGVASEEQWMKMPTMSSVFYLSDAGAPTLVLNKTTNRGGNKQEPIVPHNGYFSYPRKNRYFMFKGDLGHGVVGTLGSKKKRGKKERRLTFLVNWWDKMPMEPYCRPISDGQLVDMVGRESMDGSAKVWPSVEKGLLTSFPRPAAPLPLHLSAGEGRLTPREEGEEAKVWGAEKLGMQEIKQPQTIRYFFDYPKPNAIAPRELYAVEWAEGHVFGNVDELDLSNRMVVHMLQYVKMPIVVVFVEAGDDRDTYERSVVLPVATEFAGRMKFYTALPSRTAPKLKQYGLTAGDCPTVVIDDGVGGLGRPQVYMPPAALRGTLEAAALREFLEQPTAHSEL